MAAWGWALLALLLILNSFGFYWTFHIIICLLAFALGLFSIITVFYRYGQSRRAELLAELSSVGDLYNFTPGLKELLTLKPPCSKPSKDDFHLTGSQLIDSELDDILTYTLRDFVQVWYKELSTDETFVELLRSSASQILHNLSERMRQVDWVTLLTRNLVDDFASHIRLYRKSVERLEQSKFSGTASKEDLESLFFDLELEMEKVYCRDFVSTSTQYEKAYLRDISDVLLYLILPKEEFGSKPFRLLLREVLISKLLMPLVDQISDPDYVNQTIVWLLAEIPINYEVFLSVLEDSDHLDELVAVRDCLDHEIAAQRSKDTGDAVKQQLNSLLYVKKLVDLKIEQINEEFNSPVKPFKDRRMASANQNLPDLSLGYIVNNPVALSYLIDFLSSTDGQNLIYLFLAVEGFKLSAGQHLSTLHLQRVTRPSSAQQEIQQDMETVREAAISLYDQYLSDKAAMENKVSLDEALLKKLMNSLKTDEPSECCFDQVQAKVYELLQSDKYYGAFKKSEMYAKLLSELDIHKDQSCLEHQRSLEERADEQFDTREFSTGGMKDSAKLSAQITHIGMSKDGPKAFAVYIIKVSQENSQSSVMASWNVNRRYSDFHDLHLIIQSKFPSLSGISFPGKKTFNNLNQDFLEGRKRALNAYLKNLLYPDLFKTHKGLELIMTRFLSVGPYNQGRGITNISKKMDLFVNPILTGVKNVGNAVISMPDNFVDGVSKVGDGLGKVTRTVFGIGHQPLRPSVVISSPEGRVGAALEVENTADNIPLRIVLLLMDEVFNLKQRNQWFRRRLVAFLQQITRATFGGSINRKIVEFVQFLTCEEQVADYLRAFKTAFWPNSQIFDSVQERSKAVQMRTRIVAKAKLIAALPDELRLFIGNETTRKGALLVFEAFQNSHLNRRFTYVLLEHLLKSVFPHNRFDQIFLKLHSKSPRCQAVASC